MRLFYLALSGAQAPSPAAFLLIFYSARSRPVVCGFAVVDGRGEAAVGPRANPTEHAVHGRKAGEAEQLVALKDLQVLDGLFKSGVQFSNGVVDVGFYGCEFGG